MRREEEYQELVRLRAEVERLRIESGSHEIRASDGWTRIEAALALHPAKVDPESPSRYCSTCGTIWPCPTVKALQGGD